MNWDIIHTVQDFYDWPRKGVADFRGVVHGFSCAFDAAANEYTDRYWLTQISKDLFQLVIEEYEIFLRWRIAFDANTVGIETHPALPADRLRQQELATIIKDRPWAVTDRSVRVRGRFRSLGQHRYEVHWSELDPG